MSIKEYKQYTYYDMADSYYKIIKDYKYLGHKLEAIKYHLKVISLIEEELGTNHVDTADSYSNIANDYKDLGNL